MAGSAFAADSLVYVGTYTRTTSKGIYAFRMSGSDGKLTPLGLAAESASPSYLALHPNGKYLYAVNETNNGAVTSFSIDRATGKLTQLNAVSSKGGGPCHINIDPSGRTALIANYGGGSIASYGIGADGKLTEAVSFIQHSGSSVNPQRQREPHAHSIDVDPKRGLAIVADLGLDKLFFYKLDASKHTLSAAPAHTVSLPPGTGPRHFAMHPNGKYGYVIGEMLMTVTTVDLQGYRVLDSVTTLPGPVGPGDSTAEIEAHRSGKFVFGSNRGHNTIAGFTVDPKKGTLKPNGHTSTQGKTPRNFAIDPSGNFLLAANQDSDSIVQFRIGPDGKLSPTGQTAEVGMPVCIRYLSLGK